MPSEDVPTIDALKDKTLLYVGCRFFVTTDEELDKSAWVALKKMGIKSINVVLQKSLINVRWCKKMKAMGIIDEYNLEGMLQEKREERSVQEVGDGIIAWLREKDIQVNACCFYGDYMGMIGGYVCEALGVAWNSYESMTAAFMKNVTQDYVLKAPQAAKYGVPSYSVETEKQLLSALDKMKFPVVMKPVCGSGSVGCKVLDDVTSCQEFFSEVSHGLKEGSAACEKITFSQSIVVMEFLQGLKYTVDVVISQGKLVGGAIAERGPATLPYFWATSVSLPGDATEAVQKQLIEAAYQCCMAVGLRNGVYDVDLIRDTVEEAIPKLIEINPRPGGNCLMELMRHVYGVDLFRVNLLLCCGVDISDDDVKLQPQTNAVGYLMYLHRDYEKLQKSFGYILSMAKDNKITIFNPGWQTTAEHLYKKSKTVRPTSVLMSSDNESKQNAVDNLARFLVDTNFFESLEDALPNF